MRLVIIESPYAGDVDENIKYAIECMRDSLFRDEAPLASHLLYTQALDDKVPEERHLGIQAGLEWGLKADLTVVYADLGISEGMQQGMRRASNESRTIEVRYIRRG